MFLFQLVSSFQTEAQNRTVESEQTKQKLSALRKMIARLLMSINDVSDQCHSSLISACIVINIFANGVMHMGH